MKNDYVKMPEKHRKRPALEAAFNAGVMSMAQHQHWGNGQYFEEWYKQYFGKYPPTPNQ